MFTSVLVAPDVSGHDHFGTLCTGSSHGKSAQAPIRLLLVTLHSVYDCLGQLALASKRTPSIFILLNLRSPRDYVGSSVPPFVHSFAPVVVC